MRCARLLSYLMIEFEVPIVVKQAIKCARIFFFGLVDFSKLDLSFTEELKNALESQESNSELLKTIKNEFIANSLQRIGSRVSLSHQDPVQNSQEHKDSEKEESKEEDEDKTNDKKYVVYANINSQNEDFTFLVTALFHWENLYPRIQPT